MRVLGIVGSPRRNQNTALLVERVLEGARSIGAATEVVHLGAIRIGACMACDGCKKKSRCVQKDDMQRVYDLISESRALVLGSPVYFDQVSAQAKMFIDRLYCYTYTDQGVANFPAGYKGVVAIAYEDSHPARYVYVLEWLKERLEHYHKIEIIGSLSAGGTAGVPVSKREDLLGLAFELGRQLGQHVKTF